MLALCGSKSLLAGVEEFAFYDLEVRVADIQGQPVEASVRVYSKDWLLDYPQIGNAVMGTNSSFSFHLPRGDWVVVAGGGQSQTTARSGRGLFLVTEVDLESNRVVELKPDHSFSLEFFDREGHLADLDSVFAGPSSLGCDCRLPDIGRTRSGICEIETNLRDDLSLFLFRKPVSGTGGQEGYFVFLDHQRCDQTVVVRASARATNHIHFACNGPENSPGPVTWTLNFPYVDPIPWSGHRIFTLAAEAEAFTSEGFIQYFPTIQVTAQDKTASYYFCGKGIDFSSTNYLAVGAGGPLSRRFSYCPIPFDSSRSLCLLGPVLDAFGNELIAYSSSEQVPLTVWESEGGPVLYDTPLVPGAPRWGQLNCGLPRSFPTSAVFRVEWDLGPYDGTRIFQGALRAPEYLWQPELLPTRHLRVQAPPGQHEKSALLAHQLESGCAAMAQMLGKDVPEGHRGSFWVFPEDVLVAGPGGCELYYHGYVEWHHRDPLAWEQHCFHELAHGTQGAFALDSCFLYTVQLNETVAELLSFYAVDRLRGAEYAQLYQAERAHRFFGFMADPGHPAFNEGNLLFVVTGYLTQKCGWGLHMLFFRNWPSAYQALAPAGFSEREAYAALYSKLVGQNLAWLFNLCGFQVSEERLAQAISMVTLVVHPGPAVVTRSPTSQVVSEGYWTSFNVEIDGTPPYGVQWTRNGSPLLDATNTRLEIGPCQLSDSSAAFAVVVTNAQGISTSQAATLTVVADDIPPRIVGVRGSSACSQLEVIFSEPVLAISATNPANYSLSVGGPIVRAEMGPSSETVILTVQEITNMRLCVLRAQNIQDCSARQNRIAANAEYAFTPTPCGLLASLVGYWTFDEGRGLIAHDHSGHNHHARLLNGAQWSAEGVSGGCIALDGLEAVARVELPEGLPAGNAPRTVAAWAKCFGEMPNNKFQYVAGYGAAHGIATLFAIGRGGLSWEGYWKRLFFLGWNADVAGTAIDAFPTGNWVHVAATYDGASLRLYLNGHLEASAEKTLDTEVMTDLFIGGCPNRVDSMHRPFHGAIDEVYVFNRDLNENEIRELMYRPVRRPASTGPTLPQKDSVARGTSRASPQNNN